MSEVLKHRVRSFLGMAAVMIAATQLSILGYAQSKRAEANEESAPIFVETVS
jgi:hypothetical protein